MQILKTAAFWQILIVFVLLLAAAHVPAQIRATTNEKPKPILFGRLQKSKNFVLPTAEQKIASRQSATNSESVALILETSTKKQNSATLYGVAPSQLEKETFDLINAERKRNNLPPLVFDSAMLYLARKHSENMAQFSFFNHRDFDGARVDKRAEQAGINDWRAIAENIAVTQEAKNSVAVAVECWLRSVGHRSNMLSKKWTRSGVGIALAPDGKFYFTQVFRD